MRCADIVYKHSVLDERDVIMSNVIFKYEVIKDCKGNDFKKFAPSPQCGNCDALCGFYRDTCPNCGAKLDRANVERVQQ